MSSHKKVATPRPNSRETETAIELLIREGVFLTDEIRRLNERLQICKQSIEGYFPALKTMEQFTTNDGVATRRIQNSWNVDQKKIKEIQELIGDREKEFLRQTVDWKPTAKLRSTCLDADSQIGKELKRYVYVDQNISISFHKLESVEQNAEPEDAA